MSLPARVTRVDRTRILCRTDDHAELSARVPKRLRGDPPVVGDLVDLDPPPGAGDHVLASIHPRKGVLLRQAAGRETRAQPLAANVDVAFVVQAADAWNGRTLERYQALCAAGGVRCVPVASKTDLAPAPEGALAVSCVTREGLDALRREVGAGTAVLLGPSGVGKSSLVNALLGEDALATDGVRDDGKGRHTTTRRELLALPGGGSIIDTPGMRALALWDADGLAAPFADVEALARRCRFSDCRHETEPGCAARGVVEPGRLDALRKLQREARRQDERAARADARQWGRMGRDAMRAKDARRQR